mmetsp:Transcript_41086/g.55807  ORF Transcript_41086/g.55807 Transcript_41086/m.55807 type:complete len:85 (+) Transcript_41086:1517-1771(+)
MRNPVVNMSFMAVSTDIPDWIIACCLNKELTSYAFTAEDNAEFFKRSPQSVIKNVTTPTMLLIGTHDARVPPHQSYYYYNSLKQ